MFKISNTVAGVATLALAALPMFAMATSAYAAPVTVQVADLNLASPQDAREFDRRVDIAANDFCADTIGLSARAACKAGVRDEVSEKLEAMRTSARTYAAR